MEAGLGVRRRPWRGRAPGAIAWASGAGGGSGCCRSLSSEKLGGPPSWAMAASTLSGTSSLSELTSPKKLGKPQLLGIGGVGAGSQWGKAACARQRFHVADEPNGAVTTGNIRYRRLCLPGGPPPGSSNMQWHKSEPGVSVGGNGVARCACTVSSSKQLAHATQHKHKLGFHS